jgi:hypothetical protein
VYTHVTNTLLQLWLHCRCRVLLPTVTATVVAAAAAAATAVVLAQKGWCSSSSAGNTSLGSGYSSCVLPCAAQARTKRQAAAQGEHWWCRFPHYVTHSRLWAHKRQVLDLYI